MRPQDYVERFGDAAKAGAVYELRLRMLADKIDATKGAALEHRLEDVERAVAVHYAPHLSPTELTTLEKSRRVRNKLVHIELSMMRDLLVELGLNPPEGLVTAVDIQTGKRSVVSDTDMAEGRIYGWLLECAAAGLFDAAEHLFNEAIIIVFRLMDIADRERMATP